VSPDRNSPEVRLRVLVSDDASWVVNVDRVASTALARSHGWDEDKLGAELGEGLWASDDRWGWAVMVDGQPHGFALVTGMETRNAEMSVRIGPAVRGKGVGREVLRQLADHHFQASDELVRFTGCAHEHNVPMQRVFNAAGFRMEARYRDAFEQPDGRFASEWGYALTRADWEVGRHRADGQAYDLHGLNFEIEEVAEGPPQPGLVLRFLQEGKRVIGRYDGHEIVDGEIGGILTGDLLRYRYVHGEEQREGVKETLGRGRARFQQRDDGRLELVDRWSDEEGSHGRRVLVQRRAAV
jgi:RimJ/RimL family protein N-acetyltransferase